MQGEVSPGPAQKPIYASPVSTPAFVYRADKVSPMSSPGPAYTTLFGTQMTDKGSPMNSPAPTCRAVTGTQMSRLMPRKLPDMFFRSDADAQVSGGVVESSPRSPLFAPRPRSPDLSRASSPSSSMRLLSPNSRRTALSSGMENSDSMREGMLMDGSGVTVRRQRSASPSCLLRTDDSVTTLGLSASMKSLPKGVAEQREKNARKSVPRVRGDGAAIAKAYTGLTQFPAYPESPQNLRRRQVNHANASVGMGAALTFVTASSALENAGRQAFHDVNGPQKPSASAMKSSRRAGSPSPSRAEPTSPYAQIDKFGDALGCDVSPPPWSAKKSSSTALGSPTSSRSGDGAIVTPADYSPAELVPGKARNWSHVDSRAKCHANLDVGICDVSQKNLSTRKSSPVPHHRDRGRRSPGPQWR